MSLKSEAENSYKMTTNVQFVKLKSSKNLSENVSKNPKGLTEKYGWIFNFNVWFKQEFNVWFKQEKD